MNELEAVVRGMKRTDSDDTEEHLRGHVAKFHPVFALGVPHTPWKPERVEELPAPRPRH